MVKELLVCLFSRDIIVSQVIQFRGGSKKFSERRGTKNYKMCILQFSVSGTLVVPNLLATYPRFLNP